MKNNQTYDDEEDIFQLNVKSVQRWFVSNNLAPGESTFRRFCEEKGNIRMLNFSSVWKLSAPLDFGTF